MPGYGHEFTDTESTLDLSSLPYSIYNLSVFRIWGSKSKLALFSAVATVLILTPSKFVFVSGFPWVIDWSFDARIMQSSYWFIDFFFFFASTVTFMKWFFKSVDEWSVFSIHSYRAILWCYHKILWVNPVFVTYELSLLIKHSFHAFSFLNTEWWYKNVHPIIEK